MDQISLSRSVICRPALVQDHADVIEFCKGIWEGDDYVPEMWDEWVHDPKGLLAVAEFSGHVIGCSKITWISKGQWWLEGFRVDPNYQGLKVGSRIHEYVTDWWLEHGDGTLRLMTDAGNFAVHHLCVKTGYAKIHEVCAYKAIPLAEPCDNFSLVTERHEAVEFAMASESLRATDGLLDLGWRIGRIDESAFDVYSQADQPHSFYWWKDRQGLFSVWLNEDEDKRILVIGVVACALNDMPDLLMDARRLAAQMELDIIFQIAFDTPEIISCLEAAGFEKKWKRSNAFVFEKKHRSRI